MKLGKLEQITDLRSVWKHEAKDFTPWLAKEENLEILSEAVGIDIVVEEQESNVGDFSVDLFATEEGTGRRIIIENQLEETNHDHLGKIITYASGKEAEVIIWIVRKARDEHKQAIEWLNQHTDDKFEFSYEKFYKLKFQEFKQQFLERQNMFGVYPQDCLDEKEWSFSDMDQLMLKKKIENGHLALKYVEGVKIYRGVTTGYNPAFIISNEQRDKLIAEDRKNSKVIKNMLQGRNIRKWYYNDSDEYLLQTGYDTNIENDYPSIYLHLLQFKENLILRTDKGDKWYNLRACKYYGEFEKSEKIIWGLTADKWAYTLDTRQHYLPSNAYILTSETIPIRFILGLLNSKLLRYYFGFIGVMTAGGAYTLKASTIEALPIAIGTKKQQKEIALKVENILNAKAKNKQIDVSLNEHEIDCLVYNLYGLSEKEIKIVEGV